MIVSVCLPVCLSTSVSQKLNFTKFSVNVNCVGVARTTIDDNATHCVLLVLWMTLCLPIMGHMAYVANRLCSYLFAA